MTIFSEGDTLTLPGWPGVTWQVTSVRLRTGDDTGRTATPRDQRESPREVTVGLTDRDNPGKHGTAMNAAVLADRMSDYRQNSIVALVDQLSADLVANGVSTYEARPLAGRLVIAGWKR